MGLRLELCWIDEQTSLVQLLVAVTRKLADNNAVLMEQNASVEAKLQRAEARLVNAAKLELENEVSLNLNLLRVRSN